MTATDPLPACPGCGATLPHDAPEGLCPRCLAAVNFATDTLVTGPGSALPPPPISEIAPHFPQLEILSCLGRGGMGVVYKARQISLDRLVALKLLAPEREKDPEFSQRFAVEAQALARMSHPHIVTVHDFGQAGGFFYLLMEYVDGANLRQLLQAHRFTPEQALTMVPPLCDALQYAHERGIVHRDIKPENLLIDREGKLKVADFGLAKLLGSDATGDERAAGTPGYMAPEQAADPARTDSRADIYALGVVIYEMLTGELPGPQFKPPSQKAAIDSRLDDVVLRAMDQDPDRRFQQASTLKTEIENITRTAPPPPAPPPAASPALPAAGPVPPDIAQPANAMLITALVSVAMHLLTALGLFAVMFIPSAFAGGFLGQHFPYWAGIGLSLALFLGVLLMVVTLGLNLAAVYGAMEMRRLGSYSWAMAGAIILMLAGLISLPAVSVSMGGILSFAQLGFGVWGLVVLQREDVKAAFRANRNRTPAALPADAPPTLTDEASPAGKLSIPAIGLMAVAVLNGIAWLLFSIVRMATRSPFENAPPLVFGGLTLLLGIALSATLFAGAWQMRKSGNHLLAVVSAVIAILTPPGCMIGWLFGIWALIVLFDSKVKATFSTGTRYGARSFIAIAATAVLCLVVPVLAIVTTTRNFTNHQVRFPTIPTTSFSFGTSPPPIPIITPGITPSAPTLPPPAVTFQENSGDADDFTARFDACRMISDQSVRDGALAKIALDAAAAGKAEITRKAIGSISDMSLRDGTSYSAAMALSDHGYRREAVETTRRISDQSKRDATLLELSTRKAPDEQGPER